MTNVRLQVFPMADDNIGRGVDDDDDDDNYDDDDDDDANAIQCIVKSGKATTPIISARP